MFSFIIILFAVFFSILFSYEILLINKCYRSCVIIQDEYTVHLSTR